MAARKRYPPLPKVVEGLQGPLSIVLSKAPGGDASNMGHFNGGTRTIEVSSTLRKDQQWMVLFHEITHAALWDSGAHNLLAEGLEENICDALAAARMRERFG